MKSAGQPELPDPLDQDKTDNEYVPPTSVLKKTSRKSKLADSPSNTEVGICVFGKNN